MVGSPALSLSVSSLPVYSAASRGDVERDKERNAREREESLPPTPVRPSVYVAKDDFFLASQSLGENFEN